MPERAVFPLALLKVVAEAATARRPKKVSGRRAPTEPLLLTGLCYCAHCDRAANHAIDQAHRTRLNSLAATKPHQYRHPSGVPCSTYVHSVPAERLEQEVGRLIDLLCLSNVTLAALQQMPDAASSAQAIPDNATRQKALAAYEQRLTRAKQLYLALDIDEQEYQNLATTCRQAIARIKAAALAPTEQRLPLEYGVSKLRQLQTTWQTGERWER